MITSSSSGLALARGRGTSSTCRRLGRCSGGGDSAIGGSVAAFFSPLLLLAVILGAEAAQRLETREPSSSPRQRCVRRRSEGRPASAKIRCWVLGSAQRFALLRSEDDDRF